MEAANALVAKANKQYALKDYAEAADKYAEAAEEVAKVNGEDDPRNADVLFLYGRCLFKLAVERSQVLGGGGTDDKAADKAAVGATPKEAPKGPMFSFEGDEPDEEDEDAQADEEDQEDDFHNAWEVLDMARVMYEKQRDAASSEDAIDIKKRLGDTFELLGEIALENGTASIHTVRLTLRKLCTSGFRSNKCPQHQERGLSQAFSRT
jgi:HAT1-interacting factor 1